MSLGKALGWDCKVLYRQPKSERAKKPKYCEGKGGSKLKLKSYRAKPKEPKNPHLPKHESCKNKAYKLVEITSYLPPGHHENPNDAESKKWVRVIHWQWFCEDCYVAWNYGLYAMKCTLCNSKFHYNYDNDNTRGNMYCPYCRRQIVRWKKINAEKWQKQIRVGRGWKSTNEFAAIIYVPKKQIKL